MADLEAKKKKLVILIHPDKNPGDQQRCTRVTAALTNAMDLLREKEKGRQDSRARRWEWEEHELNRSPPQGSSESDAATFYATWYERRADLYRQAHERMAQSRGREY